LSYIFAGWYTQANGGGSEFTESTAVSGNIIVYAQWTGETYTVTFMSNYAPDMILYTKTVTVPATTILITDFPVDPARTGYNFGSWNTQANGSGSGFAASTAVNASITVYAQWDTYSYTVTFNNDGGDTAAVPAAKIVASPAVNIDALPAPPTRSGYIFAGWYTQADGGSEFTATTTISGNITVYAKWTGETYTVTFKSNYDTNETLYTKTVTVPATTIADFPANPTRTGYIFGGWNTRDDGGGNGFTALTAVTGNITVYAQWDTYSYTVTFNNNGGDTAADPSVKTVASPAVNVGSLPVPPSRAGYTFAGWNTHAGGGGSQFTESTAVTGNITVHAQWTGETYTVTFKSNYGTNETLDTKTVTVPATKITGFPANPTRTGYIFGGWNTQVDGDGTPFTASTVVSANMTVHAQWTGETYTVTFKSNYGANNTLDTKTVTVPATTIADFPADPARTGYNFGSWNTQADGGGSGFTESTAVSANITVHAQWDTYSYTVTFNNNGGDTAAVPAAKTVASPETSIDSLPAPPARSGYTFAGWNTAPAGPGSSFTATTTVSGNITIYARWTGALITLNPDAGDGAFSQGTFTLSKNGDESQTITITGSGYTNPRWFVDGELKETENSITINAADYGIGGHKLTLLISKNGVSWSKEISFTVAN
jgi:uncharacterized repeat protein (TIGR02543 family)